MKLTHPQIRLGTDALAKVSSEVQIPAYDRRRLRHHTVHIGVGGFHRAHQAVYLDDLLAHRDAERWGECGVGVLATDLRMRDALHSQNCLYTVVERSAYAQTARIIGSMTGYIFAPEDRESTIEKLAAADTRIVSLTITEGGYFIHEGTGEFMAGHPDIERDLRDPAHSTTWMGLVAESLDRRRRRELPPFTLMSCDNLQGNGDVAKRVLLAFTGLLNPALQQWIAANGAFPNSMVDRITPGTTPADIAFVSERFCLDDAWPVVTEPFRQWVIEDAFCNGRPEWERVGAEFTSDVASYEIMKMRLLNGSHLAMAYLGALRGFTFVHEVMSDSLFIRFIDKFMEEVTPVVPVIPGVSIPDYKSSLMERFANPTINDQVTRICSEGSAKIPKWLLPSIQELLARQRPIRLLGLVIASWIRYLALGVDESGTPLAILDVRAAELKDCAQASLKDPRAMLADKSIFGEDLPQSQEFIRAVEAASLDLDTLGVETAMRRCLGGIHTQPSSVQ